MMGMI
jgi:hypothetical protein